MLQKLSITNYAIIDQLSITPDAHLNIVTGETGAGKSIIIGALSLILGERADTSVLINKEAKCVVEAHFDVHDNATFLNALKAEELDDEKTCIIRREISSSGKSRAFVNDTPVTLSVLHKLTSLLVDLHQQFDTLSLENDLFQLEIVDALSVNRDYRDQYKLAFALHKKLSDELSGLKTRQSAWQKEADYKQYLLEELQQLELRENEIEDAEQQLKQLNAAEKIVNTLQAARYVLEEQEQPLSNEIKRQAQQLLSITDVMPAVAALHERLLSVYAELKDVSSELEHLESTVSMQPERMLQLQEKIDAGNRLLKKHAVQTTNELLGIQQQLEQELQETMDLNEQIERLAIEEKEALKRLYDIAGKLTHSRKNAIPGIETELNNMMSAVGMPNAKLQVRIESLNTPAPHGLDQVSFQLDANKSGQFQPLYKAASGGEMSRIMLCIKTLTAKAIHMPTLIFDEVDTGISGEAARKVGTLLSDLSHYHQVICITHQPQVAAKGSKHLFVYKSAGEHDKITTRVKELNGDERVLAIARMIGGETPSEAAINNARELVVQ